jgi:hypothetical protein
MSRRLDDELSSLKAEGSPTSLSQLESAVWRRIDAEREDRAAWSIFLPVRAAAVVAALGIGVAGGGFAAAAVASEPHEISVFSIDARLAPSTLLDGHG